MWILMRDEKMRKGDAECGYRLFLYMQKGRLSGDLF